MAACSAVPLCAWVPVAVCHDGKVCSVPSNWVSLANSSAWLLSVHMHIHAWVEQQRQVKSCSRSNRARFLHQKQQQLLQVMLCALGALSIKSSIKPSPALMGLSLSDPSTPGVIPATVVKSHKLHHYDPFLIQFALLILWQQNISISNPQHPTDTAPLRVLLGETFPNTQHQPGSVTVPC